jgi:putative glutamine amidotransferase
MSDPLPVIGIVTALEQARYGGWDEPCALLQTSYVNAVQQAGAIALMIPPDPVLSEHPGPVLDRIDGLLLAGGSDLDPATYGAEPHLQTVGTNAVRDETEVALARAALERDMPVLGICRGMQVLNVALGGTLIQHVPELVGHDDHRRHLGTFVDNDHTVVLAPGSLAAQAAGEQRHLIFSHHHQAIGNLGTGLIVTGRSVLDELPEALESPEHDYVLGVQWHPEADPASTVIDSLVQRAAERQGLRRPATSAQ